MMNMQVVCYCKLKNPLRLSDSVESVSSLDVLESAQMKDKQTRSRVRNVLYKATIAQQAAING